MKKLALLLLAVSWLTFSCSDDEDTPVVANFTATVTGEAPNAQVTIVNTSTGADTYLWTFSEGTANATSTQQNPGVITVDKVGTFSITLEASKGSSKNTKTVDVTITGKNPVVTYTDVEFAMSGGSTTYGRLFSFADGKIYKDNELNATVGPKINLAFGSLSNSVLFFESPTESGYNVPGAVATKVMNYEATPSISTSDFDAMVDDSKLAPLTINDTNDSFGSSSIPNTVLFQLSTGRKGVIKTKAVNASRILVDIKIQKY